MIARVLPILPYILVGVLSATTVSSVHEVKSLRSEIKTLKGQESLAIGAFIPAIAVTQVGRAQSEHLQFADEPIPTLIYVFTPQCGWCARNLENARHLLGAARGSYRVVGVSLSTTDLEPYLRRAAYPFTTYVNLSSADRFALRMGATPQTIVIGTDGRVRGNWMGAYAGDVASDIAKFFHVSLPGLGPLNQVGH